MFYSLYLINPLLKKLMILISIIMYLDGLTMRSNLINCVTGDTIHTIRDELASYFCSQSMKVSLHSYYKAH